MARNSIRLFAVSNRMIIGYHPETPVAYEYTKPMPARVEKDTSLLKEVPHDIFNEGPNLEQIQALTYTPRRYWIEYHGKDLRNAYKNSFNQKKNDHV